MAGSAKKKGIRMVVRQVIRPSFSKLPLGVPNFLHEITKTDGRVLESMSKVIDLRNGPSPSLVFPQVDQLLRAICLGVYVGVDEFVPLVDKFNESPSSFLES